MHHHHQDGTDGIIREAAVRDVPAVARMAQAFHAESHYAQQGIAFDLETMEITLSNLVDSNHGVVLIADGCGFAAGLIFPLYFNAAQITGQELLLWVEPGHRHGVGRRLQRALERTFIERGATLLMMTATQTCRPDLVGAIYERAGYRLADRTYTKVIVQ